MPTAAATARAAAALSPVSSTGRRPSARSSATAAALVGFTVSATTSDRPRLAVPAGDHGRAAVVLGGAPRPGGEPPAARCPGRPRRRRGRRRRRARRPRPRTPSPGRLANSVDARQAARPAPRRPRRWPGRSGARDAPRARRPAAAPRASSTPSATIDGDQRHAAGGDRAGLVEHDRVDPAGALEHLRALDEDAELRAPAGADQQRRRRGQAERARAGDDQHGDGGGERRRRHRPCRRARQPSVATAMTMHDRHEDGRDPVGQPLHRRLAGLGLLRPGGPIWASAVSAPTRVARTTSRPPALTVAPTTPSPGPTSTGTLSPVSMRGVDGRACPRRPRRRWRSSRRAGRRTRSPTASWSIGTRRSAPSREHGHVLGAELEQGAQGGTGPALRPRLEVAAGEQEHGDRGSDLEVELVACRSPRARVSSNVIVMPASPASPKNSATARPGERGGDAERDQRVHGGGAVAQVRPARRGGTARRPTSTTGRGQREGEPLPVAELQRRDHRQQHDGHGEDRRPDETGPQRGEPGFGGQLGRIDRLAPGRRGVTGRGERRRAIARLLDGPDEVVGSESGRVVGDSGQLGGVVDRRRHAVELVQALLDVGRARRARHAGHGQVDVGRR